jgi:hypothetical protein
VSPFSRVSRNATCCRIKRFARNRAQKARVFKSKKLTNFCLLHKWGVVALSDGSLYKKFDLQMNQVMCPSK